MKLKDVIVKAMAKKINRLEAVAIIGVCDRGIRRMRTNWLSNQCFKREGCER